MRLFSHKDRPVHLGPYPLERLARTDVRPDLSEVPAFTGIIFDDSERSDNLINAMAPYAAMLDAIRDGMVKQERGDIPSDPDERSQHLKAFSYYQDSSQSAVCALAPDLMLAEPISNPGIESLAADLRNKEAKTLAPGIDMIMAELRQTMLQPPRPMDDHRFALVCLCEFPRDPTHEEAGCDWFVNGQSQRASIRAAETAVILASYIRLLGFDARAHTGSCTEVDLNKLVVAAGLGEVKETALGLQVVNPYLGTSFGVAAVTTVFELAPDQPLKSSATRTFADKARSHGPAWWVGKGFVKNALNKKRFKGRLFKDGEYPFETLRRVETPTTFIDEPRVPRVPKRADMFARAVFGEMGKPVQEGSKQANYVRKAPTSAAALKALGAFTLLQKGDPAPTIHPDAENAARNADRVKAALYFLGADAVGISRCPDWAYYSHNALGQEMVPYHDNAISVVIDQGYETMEGASGDDWIACSQSMRAYLRFSLLGGIIAQQIRNLGYSARTHTVIDGEVLQPPLLLLSGLGEVSRIGEVILNPFLGPRLKSGAITTDMPLAHDKPIDFGLQNFCNSCNKCARECPSGAITAGPKTMFNGYEIWKSDSQKCTTYRITQAAGAMCGRCMKTCPWNLEGLFAEAPFRWLASHAPGLAKPLAKLDDAVGNGSINPVKKWWWDLEMVKEGPYTVPEKGTNDRNLQKDLDLKHEDQTLAVYPANLAPHPYPYPFPMDREAGIKAYKAMLSPDEYKTRLKNGETKGLAHEYKPPKPEEAPVLCVAVKKAEVQTEAITKYLLTSLNGQPLPAFDAGAHIDVVVAPEYLRQYSLAGDPANDSHYEIGVLREDKGRGGSALLHRVFQEGRRVFISKPINHFPLNEDASKSFLMGGGIGVTPMIAMAHRLHKLGADFEFHYSSRSRQTAGFLSDLESVPWASNVVLHFSDEGSRADLPAVFGRYHAGRHIYTCGPEVYMSAVLQAGEEAGFPESAMHREFFSVPEAPDYENHAFTLRLKQSGKEIPVSADESAADALIKRGFPVDLKCSDGICGVCKCGLVDGDVEHRDFVLSNAQRKEAIILCQSRAAAPDGVIEIDL